MSSKGRRGSARPTNNVPVVSEALPPPSPEESAAIADARQRLSQRPPRVTLKIVADEDGKVATFHAPHDDRPGLLEQLQDAFGSRGLAFASSELNHLMQAAQLKDGTTDGTRLNAMLAVVDGLKPANEVEGMLASQIAVTHKLAMELMKRTQRAEHLPQFESSGRMAARLLNAFTTQVELLHRLQRGPGQTVRVEHVHVHSGGQAIVGNVAQPSRRQGEGGEEK